MANFLIACTLATWAAVVVTAAASGSPRYAPSEPPVVTGGPIYAPSGPPVVTGGPGYAPSQVPSSVATAPGSEAGVGGDCSALIYEMMECMSFLSGEGGEMAAPGEPCCAGFKTVVDANAGCICYALGSAASLGLVINITRAAALSSLCRVSAPPISYCDVSLSPGGSPVSSPPSASPANSPTHGSSAPPSNSPSTLPRLTPPPAPATSAPKSAPPPATSATTVPPTATSPPSLAPAATSDDTTMPPDSEATSPPPQKAGAYSISPAFLLVFASFLLFSA
ncbi:hypothetical protein ACP275_03G016500 [Erythranthe tilingii]